MSERRSSELRGVSALGERRRRRRRLVRTLVVLLFVLGLGAWGWVTWQPAVRISEVAINAGDPVLAAYASAALTGTYAGLIPRDSIFFFPARSIRSSILTEHPEIAAVSISREGLTKIAIATLPRVAIGKWCGLSPSVISPDVPFDSEYCYVFDGGGYMFAPLVHEDISTGSTTVASTINTFSLYAPLQGETEEPLRATLAGSDALPAVFDFARQFSTRVVPVRSVVIAGDEAHFSLANGARLLYIIGEEHTAFSAVIASQEATDLADPSISYIDVRFEGKVYLKRKE
jgi:hypothetical protein